MILVTGATGFVGRRVVEALTSVGRPVRALVHTASRASVLSGFDVEKVRGDVRDPEFLRRACEGVDAIIHLVATIRESPGATFQRINYQGTINVLEAASFWGVERVVHASVLGASPDRGSPYLYSRWMAEQEVIRNSIPHTVIRFSFGFGEGDEFLNVLAAQIRLAPVVAVAGGGKARLQPVAVEDMARCLVAACVREDMGGRVIEIGGPAHLTYVQILDVLADALNVKIFKVHVPMPLLMPVVAAMEVLVPRPPATREMLKVLGVDSATELDAMEKDFGLMPRPLRGNIDYVSRIGLGDALKIVLGFMPAHIRDH